MTVAFILAMRSDGQAPTLVVAPKSVCRQWKDEIEKFSGMSCALYEKGMTAEAISGVDVLVASYSFFMRESCLDSAMYASGFKFHRVILDEAHFVKNPNTVSARHIRMLGCDKRLCLSGTPIQNDPRDLFSLVKWIFQHEASVTSKLNMSSRSKATRMRCTEFIRNNMLMRRTLDDVSAYNADLTLPTLSVRIVSVPFATRSEAQLYDHIEDIARERIKNVLKSYHTQSNMDILEALLRCRQVCIHHRLFVDALHDKACVSGKWKVPHRLMAGLPEHGTKLSTLVKMISSHPGDKTLVFCSFVKEMRIIQSMLRGQGVHSLLYYGDMSGPERDEVLDKFKDPRGVHTVLIIQMNAGGTGLNLQVANRCYVTSPAYNPSLELQCIARSHRTGQTKEVTCIRLVMQDTVEERILDIQKKKLDMISLALDDQRISEKLNKNCVQLSKDDICSLFDLEVPSAAAAAGAASASTSPSSNGGGGEDMMDIDMDQRVEEEGDEAMGGRRCEASMVVREDTMFVNAKTRTDSIAKPKAPYDEYAVFDDLAT
jgi:SNF2 family DNA or RNA helicase